MKKLGHFAIAVSISLLINGFCLFFLHVANKTLDNKKSEEAPVTKSIAINDPPPKKQPRNRVRTTSKRVTSSPRQSAVPNLPSKIVVPGLALSNNPSSDFTSDLGGELEAISSDFVFKEEAVDNPPRVIGRVAPKYPWGAKRRGDEGHVVFKLRLSETGKIEKLWTVESHPAGIFDAEAERAVRQYRFSPATYNGKPVPVICKQRIEFRLGG